MPPIGRPQKVNEEPLWIIQKAGDLPKLDIQLRVRPRTVEERIEIIIIIHLLGLAPAG
jgi:hypothetical protein